MIFFTPFWCLCEIHDDFATVLAHQRRHKERNKSLSFQRTEHGMLNQVRRTLTQCLVVSPTKIDRV